MGGSGSASGTSVESWRTTLKTVGPAESRRTGLAEGAGLAELTRFDPVQAPSFSWRAALPTMVMDGALPLLGFVLLTRWGVPVLYALLAGGVFPAMNSGHQWAKTRRLEPVGIIVMTFLALGAAASLISGSPFFALAKESFLTATFGVICLASLLAGRPLMFSLLRQFMPDGAWWDGLWRYSNFRAMMRKITAVWGIAYIVEALVRLVLVTVLSPALVVAISPMMMFAIVIALSLWTRRTLIVARERRLRELGIKPAT